MQVVTPAGVARHLRLPARLASTAVIATFLSLISTAYWASARVEAPPRNNHTGLIVLGWMKEQLLVFGHNVCQLVGQALLS